jgi:Tfp pilus assembly protein PilX
MPRTLNKTQRGAALVIAMILLVALTLLGIASMNTASLDLIMAGNEQFRGRAFETAEVGIEAALASADANFDTSLTTNSGTITLGNDSYNYTIAPQEGGQTISPPPGYSQSTGKPGFGIAAFRVTVTGTSARGTNTTHVQEVNQVVNAGDSTTCDPSVGSCSL